MRVCIAKPEWGITGGFELVLDRLVEVLERAGHEVGWARVDVPSLGHQSAGVEVPDDVWHQAPEYFRYMGIISAFAELDPPDADVVLCTQPGSWGIHHPRKLALFSHHLRVFYDLAEDFVAAGYVDPDLHAWCTEEVRAIDAPRIDEIAHFLVQSLEVAGRLERFNNIGTERCSPFLAGIGFRAPGSVTPTPPPADGYVLCVSRHEWPKRTELVAAAAHLLPADRGVVLVGSGGRLEHVKAIEVAFGRREVDEGEALWRGSELRRPPLLRRDGSGRATFLGHVDTDTLESLYAGALCVVCPAYLEDYGLTAVEAMAYGKPVVTCHDGGGLVDTVRHEHNGLVCGASPSEIARAVRRLIDDPALRTRLSQGAVASAAEYTWERAGAQFLDGLERAAAT
ncbi:MAG: glycosyltransferase family 4 protein [Acidimicrobiia bacterium]|nr:glycosyltransferase family 4 protein [Acidimicrobiia bacterium]